MPSKVNISFAKINKKKELAILVKLRIFIGSEPFAGRIYEK